MSGVPLSAPIVGPALQKRLRSREAPVPVVAPLLASDSLKCARRIGFRLFGVPYDVPFTRAELVRFEDGDYVDSTAAEVFAQEVNGVVQVPFNWLPDVPLKGKADAGYKRTLTRVVAEVKSATEKGWARAVGHYDSVPPGPKAEWVLQAGLAACSPTIKAQWVHIVLVDYERWVVDEWLLNVDREYDWPDQPMVLDEETGELHGRTIRSLVAEELERQSRILALCEQGTLPAREVPGYGLVMFPPSRDEKGEPWNCRFCPFQPSCSKLDAAEITEYGEMPA